jgi:hypothetical protein
MIAFSGSVSEDESKAAGFDEHFVKPLGISKLLEALKTWPAERR